LVLIDVIDDGGLAYQTPNTLVDFDSSCKQLLSINAYVEENEESQYQKLVGEISYLNNILENVKEWLNQEAKGQEVIDEYEGGLRPKCTDGSDDIIEGRVESANALLEQIRKWEVSDDE
jgi:hypothetical protein